MVRKADGYYINLTTYTYPKGGIVNNKRNNVGLDYGISKNITTSDGEVFDYSIEETKRLKRLQRRILGKSKKGPNCFKYYSPIDKIFFTVICFIHIRSLRL